MQTLLRDQIYPAEPGAPLACCFHAVQTRFNVRSMREDVGIQSRDDLKAWLDHRIPLFRDVCLPSLLGQKRRPDVWLIAFDGAEKDLVAEAISMLEGHDWILPVWDEDVNGVPGSYKAAFSQAMLSRLRPEHAYVITSRIDNDDAFGLSFCQNTERYAQAVIARRPDIEDFWLNFPVGAQLMRNRFSLYMYNSSPFISRCTTRAILERSPNSTVNRINHRKLFDEGRTVFTGVTDRPMWLQNIHGRNVSNRRKDGFTRIGPRETLRTWFGLPVKAPPAEAAPDRPLRFARKAEGV